MAERFANEMNRRPVVECVRAMRVAEPVRGDAASERFSGGRRNDPMGLPMREPEDLGLLVVCAPSKSLKLGDNTVGNDHGPNSATFPVQPD